MKYLSEASWSREENQKQTQPTYDAGDPFLESPTNLSGP